MQTHSILSISTHVQNCFYFLLFILVRVGVLLLLCLGNSRYFQFFCLLSSTCNFFSWVHCPDVKLASKKWRKSEKEKKICAKQTHHDIPSMFFGWEWGKSSSSSNNRRRRNEAWKWGHSSASERRYDMKFNLLPRRRRHRESNSFSSYAGHARALMKGTVLDSRNCRHRASLIAVLKAHKGINYKISKKLTLSSRCIIQKNDFFATCHCCTLHNCATWTPLSIFSSNYMPTLIPSSWGGKWIIFHHFLAFYVVDGETPFVDFA